MLLNNLIAFTIRFLICKKCWTDSISKLSKDYIFMISLNVGKHYKSRSPVKTKNQKVKRVLKNEGKHREETLGLVISCAVRTQESETVLTD